MVGPQPGEWRAVRFERVMASGRTRPLLLECSDGVSRRRFVTKLIGLPEVQPHSLAHELIGARLAGLFGLAVPQTQPIHISTEFLLAIHPELEDARLSVSPGLAVGSEFVPNLLPFPIPVRLQEHEIEQAAAIYVFDLLIQNPDRTSANPNCARSGSRVVIYDLETAFSFRFALMKGDAWRIDNLPFVRRHVFHRAIQEAHVDWRAIWDRFQTTPFDDVAHACSTILLDWVAVGQDVVTHLASVYDHWPEFEREVAQSLGSAS